MQVIKHILLPITAVIVCISTGCATFDRLQSSGALSTDGSKPHINLLAVKQAIRTDCGVACLSGVLGYWGDSVSQDAIKEYLGKSPEGGYTLAQLQDYAENRGYAAFILQGSWEFLQQQCALGRPIIILLEKRRERNHSIIVFDVKSECDDFLVRIMDPSEGKMKNVTASSLDTQWSVLGRPLLLVGRKD